MRRLGLVFLVAFLAFAIGAPALAQVPANVTGTVVDRATGLSLSGVAISIAGSAQKATTDAQGRFSIALPAGIYVFEARLTGYQTTDTPSVTIQANQPTALTLSL
jgi:hypothetical protein